MPTEYQQSYQGPTWQDVWLALEAIEKEFRGRTVVRMGTSKTRRGAGCVELVFIRTLTRSNYAAVAQVDDFWPSRHGKTMTAVLYQLSLRLVDEIVAFDARPYAQQRLEDLPFPPDGSA